MLITQNLYYIHFHSIHCFHFVRVLISINTQKHLFFQKKKHLHIFCRTLLLYYFVYIVYINVLLEALLNVLEFTFDRKYNFFK
jgi:hypothetical protein